MLFRTSRKRATVASAATSLVIVLCVAAFGQAAPQKKKDPKVFEADCLRAHNKWRRLHQAPELVIDKKITAFAQKRADFIAKSDGDEFKHPDDLVFGENLAWHSRPSTSCADLIKMWYDEIELYDFKRGAFSHETGHFTQLIWRETKHVGCARAYSSGPRGGIYLVCNYDPPGNFIGENQQNVLERITQPRSTTAKSTEPTTQTTTPSPSSSAAATTTTKTTATTDITTVSPTRAPADSEGQTSKKPDKKKSNGKRKNKNRKGNKNKNKNKKKKKNNNNNNNKRRNNNKKQKLESSTTTTASPQTPSQPVAQ